MVFAPGASLHVLSEKSFPNRSRVQLPQLPRGVRGVPTCCPTSPPLAATPPVKTSQDLSEPSNWHRSHFGSRYKLGCCGHASLLAAVRVPRNAQCTPDPDVIAVNFDTTSWSLIYWGRAGTPLLLLSPVYDLRPMTYDLCCMSHDMECGRRPITDHPCHVAYDSWPMSCDIWSRTCDLSPMIYTISPKTFGRLSTTVYLWLMLCDASFISCTYGSWPVSCDLWPMIYYVWSMIYDRQSMGNAISAVTHVLWPTPYNLWPSTYMYSQIHVW